MSPKPSRSRGLLCVTTSGLTGQICPRFGMQDGKCRNLGPCKVHFTEQIGSSRSLRDFGGQDDASTVGDLLAVLPYMALCSDIRCCDRPHHFSRRVVHRQTPGSKKHKADVVLNWVLGV